MVGSDTEIQEFHTIRGYRFFPSSPLEWRTVARRTQRIGWGAGLKAVPQAVLLIHRASITSWPWPIGGRRVSPLTLSDGGRPSSDGR